MKNYFFVLVFALQLLLLATFVSSYLVYPSLPREADCSLRPFLNELIGRKYRYTVVAAFLVSALLLLGSVLAGVVGAYLCALWRKPHKLIAGWFALVLRFEVIFVGVLGVCSLFWILVSSFEEARYSDVTAPLFLILFPVCLVFFLLKHFFQRKKIFLWRIFFGVLLWAVLLYGMAVNVYVYFRGETNTTYDYYDLLGRADAYAREEDQIFR